MIEITKKNYHRLRTILKNPQFVAKTFREGLDNGTIFLVDRPNTVGHLCLHEMDYGCSAFPEEQRPLVYSGSYVCLSDSYASDLFFYQYGFFFSSGEENNFKIHAHETHKIKMDTLTKLRNEGYLVKLIINSVNIQLNQKKVNYEEEILGIYGSNS